MKETIKKIENLLISAYRSSDCPSTKELQKALFGETGLIRYEQIIAHVKDCGHCRSEIRALAQISEQPLPAEFLGFDSQEITVLSQIARNILSKLLPKELAHFPSCWETALKWNWTSESRIPTASAAFSQATQDRAIRICRALLILGSKPEKTRLLAVSKMLNLSPEERNALLSEL